jgi:hypothetical protein
MGPTRYILLAALALAVLAGAPAAVAGKPVGIAEGFPTKCNVDDVAATPDGGAWFACTEYFFGPHRSFHARAKAGRITAAGQVIEFSGPVPRESEPGRQADGVIAADGSFWFPVEISLEALNHFVKTSVTPSLARVTPGGEMRLFPVTGGYVAELAATPDGSLRMKTAEGEGKNAAIWQVSPSGEMTKTADDPTLPLGETASFPLQPLA